MGEISLAILSIVAGLSVGALLASLGVNDDAVAAVGVLAGLFAGAWMAKAEMDEPCLGQSESYWECRQERGDEDALLTGMAALFGFAAAGGAKGVQLFRRDS